MLENVLIRKIRLINNCNTQTINKQLLINKQLQYTHLPIFQEVKAIRQ